MNRSGAGRVLAAFAAVTAVFAAMGSGAGSRGVAAAAGPAPRTPLTVTLKWADMLGANSYIDLSSPNLANLDGSPSIVVGSRGNGCLFAVHLSNGSTPAGWGRQCLGSIDSTPSVLPAGNGLDDVVVTTGTPNAPTTGNQCCGAIYEFNSAGNTVWSRTLPDVYGSYGPDPAIQASPAIGDTGTGSPRIVVGTLGLSLYSLDPANGATIAGWPQKTADTSFATADIAPVGGTQSIIAASDSTAGPGALNNWDGGSVRLMTATGATNWTTPSNEVMTSSPAIGNLKGAGPVVVYGHGKGPGAGPDASDSDGLTAINAATGATEWEAHLGGYTRPSPALADLLGNGQLDVVESTSSALGQSTGGTVTAFDPNGNRLWGPVIPQQIVPGSPGNPDSIIGGVATANFGGGYQDVVAATGIGWDLIDGKTGSILDAEGLALNGGAPPHAGFGGDTNWGNLAMENTPLITPDPGGGLDVVVAGRYEGVNNDTTQGFIAVYRVSSAPNTVGTGAWPMFHHDNQLTGSAIPALPPPGTCVPNTPPCTNQGYWAVASDGGLFAYGNAPFYGSMGGHYLAQPIVGMARAPNTGGYWEVASDGGIFAFNAPFYGSMGGKYLASPIVAISADPVTGGYWEVAADGGIFAFNAPFYGSMGGHYLAAPIVGMSVNGGTGYRLVASDGGIFAFGSAPFYGSMGGHPINRPIVAMATDSASGGYWEVASDGGIFAFNAPFYGSMGGHPLNAPIVGLAALGNGSGYWEGSSDGGIFSFNAYFRGSAGNLILNNPIVGIAGTG